MMRQAGHRAGVLAAALAVAAIGVVAAQDPGAVSVWQGSYTAAQAERGEGAFGGPAGCASCHGFAGPLDGNRDMFPPLAGEAFLTNLTARPVAYLHDYIRDNKPAAAPGSLRPETVLDLTAYILSRNGFPSGDAALTVERAAGILIVPDGWDGTLPDSALVRVVGCLAEDAGGGWVVDRASVPVRMESAGDGAAAPPGDASFALRFVLTPLDDYLGQRVSVSGTLVGAGGADGISVLEVEPTGERCG